MKPQDCGAPKLRRRAQPELALALLFALSGCAGDYQGPPVGGSDNPLPTGPTDDTGSADDTGASGGDDTGADDSADSAESADTGIPGSADCAVAQGSVACDLTGVDQRGEDFHLWDLHGQPVVVVVGNAWDGTLGQLSSFVEGSAQAAGGEAVVVLLDGPDQVAADTRDAAAWATTYGLSTVLSDPDYTIRVDWSENASARTWVIDADMVIRWGANGFVDADTLNAQLDAL